MSPTLHTPVVGVSWPGGEDAVAAEVWAETDRTIAEVFEAVAARRPESPAVFEGERRLDYATLVRAARGVAAAIRNANVGARAVVGVFLPVGGDHIAAVLGVLLAGRIYLSLDPAYPAARLRSMVEAAGVERIVTVGGLAVRAAELGVEATEIFGVADMPTGEAGEAGSPTGPDAVAALYFTSGSTGAPKVVAHTHRNVLFDIGRQTRDMGVTAADRFDLLFSPSFSAFLSPVFGALLTGASVGVLDLRRHPVEALRDWLEAEAITISTASVSTFRRLVGVLPPGRGLPALRMLSLGAEPLRAADVEHFRTRFAPACVLQNALATTETRTIAQAYLRADAAPPEEVCVGRPVAGKRLVLLGEDGRPVADGDVGEIVVASRFISPGPWEELRALPDRRLPGPRLAVHRTGDLARLRPDGGLVHLGRKDNQLKVRGHRVEAGEVESHLLAHPAVRDAAIFLEAGEGGRGRLVALWTRRADAPGEPDFRAHLGGRLPDYMVPNLFLEVGALPLTDTGKLDRRRLEQTWREQAAKRAEAGRADEDGAGADDAMRALWRRVLRVERIAEGDDFFALGGDSLAATELMAALGRSRGAAPPASWLLEAPTLAAFRARVAAGDDAERVGRVRRVRLGVARSPGVRPLYVIPPWKHSSILFRDLARAADGARDFWAVETILGDGGAEADSLTAIAAEVRAALERWHPDGAFDLAGFSMGGLIALDVARGLDEAGRGPGGGRGRVYLIDSSRFSASPGPLESARLARLGTWRGRLELGLSYFLRPRGVARWPIFQRLFLGKLHWWLVLRWQKRPVDPYHEAFLLNCRLGRTHVVRPHRGEVTLIRARAQGEWPNLFADDLGWRPWCPDGCVVLHVPGDHAHMLRGSIARRVAEGLDLLTPASSGSR